MVVALTLVSLSSSADAGVTLRDYKVAKNENEKTLLKMYLAGVRDGLVYLNAELEIEGRQRLFCMPDNLVLTFEQAEDIMMRKAEKTAYSDDFNISFLLKDGLKDTFPCQH
jgi:hypothetical protein